MPFFSWNSPWAFILFLPLAFVFLFILFRGKKAGFFYSDLKVFSKQAVSFRVQLLFLPLILKVLSLAFMILALARPQTIESFSRQSQEGLDIMLVMDISLSMLVEDMGISFTRLSAAKNVVTQFIQGRPFDRMGLILFSGESFTKVPLTYDHKLLEKSLLESDVSFSIKPGTAIGLALANSTARLKSSPEKSRIIIFLTDGENNAGFIDPETALNLVKKNNIKVYTVGLGRKSGVSFIKYKDRDSLGRSIYRRARIESRINKKLMEKISRETGGKFFMATSFQSLENIFNEINKIETYEIKTDSFTLYHEYFEDFLWAGFLLFISAVFLSLTVFFRGI